MSLKETLQKRKLGKQFYYETLFKNQDTSVSGKPGVILADTGVPEDYEYEFYEFYIHHVFAYLLPPFLQKMILADTGMALIDPDNPVAREPFTPKQLIDFRGSFNNKAGKPYVECEVKWMPPGQKKNPWDNGYFLYKGDGKGGSPNICQKTGAKVKGWYFDRLFPEKKVAWVHQFRKIYEETTATLHKRFPEAEFRQASFTNRGSMQQAVEELLAAGCKTIIYQCTANPAYCDFEEYAYALPLVYELVAGRARVIMADQIGNQASLWAGYAAMLKDQLKKLPKDARVLVILSKHGHPFKKDTQDERGPLYRKPLEAEIRKVMADWKGKWELLWSCDEYADEYWDPKRTKLETKAAYRMAIEQGYDYALEFPTEFMAENTDLMVFHAMKKFCAFAEYDVNAPIPYPDWDKPLVREFHEGKTTGIYAGTPVGPYRKYVVGAIVASVADVLEK